MHFPIAGFLLFGCASLSSCESVLPKLSAAVTKAAKGSGATKGSDAAADLDALDAAIGVVDKHLIKTDKKTEDTKKTTVAVKKAVKKTHKIHWAASAKPSKMPEVDVQKSKMFQKEKDLVISKEAEDVLVKGDTKAHELEQEHHQLAMSKIARAKVVHVSTNGVGKGDAVQDAKDLESDLHDLKQRIVADDKQQEEVKKEEAEERAEKAAQSKKQEGPKIQKPQKQADLNKLMKLSNEMVNDAKPKPSAAFLQEAPATADHRFTAMKNLADSVRKAKAKADEPEEEVPISSVVAKKGEITPEKVQKLKETTESNVTLPCMIYLHMQSPGMWVSLRSDHP